METGKKPEPYWEALYRDPLASAFGSSPNQVVEQNCRLFKGDWRVLDAGCGESRDLIYLARSGFKSLYGFDISPAAIEKSRKLAEYVGAEIELELADIATYRFSQKFDLVISLDSLHLVLRHDWTAFIKLAQEGTNPGGMHIIRIFTDTQKPAPDIAPFATGLAGEGEIEGLYQDWQILDFQSFIFEDAHPGSQAHFHSANQLVARKKK